MFKRIPLLLMLLAIGMIAMGADDCSTEEATVEKSGKNKSDDGAETAGVGDKLTLKGTTYKVTNATTAATLGSDFMEETANGIFVIVDLDLTNNEDEPATIFEDNLKLVGGNGKEYSTSTNASLALGDDAFLILEEIQPDLTVSGKLVYDIPPKAVKGAVLRVEDLFSNSYGEIKLALK